MGKSAILKKIHSAALNYKTYLAGRTFLFVYEGNFIEVVFKNSSFLHLTGVVTKLQAKDSPGRENLSYICGLRTRIECEPLSEHSTRSDRVTNIG